MRRTLGLLLALAASAWADRAAEMRVAGAIRSFNYLLTGSHHSHTIEQVRDIMVADLKSTSAKFSKSIRFQLDRGYKKKYGKTASFLKYVSESLAAGGSPGISKLYGRYKAESKRDLVREGIAEALGECGDERALSTLLKIIHDKAPGVAAAAVKGCASYPKVKGKVRKNAMRKLIDRYMKVSDGAAGKKPDSREMLLYKAVDPAMKASLKTLAGGEELDSAIAWDAWWRDQKEWKD